MNPGKSSIFPCGGISVRVAAQQKGVSHSTIYRWIKSGKLSAEKIKGRYCIATDELFERAAKYQRGVVNEQLQNENLQLKQQLHETQQQLLETQECCRELSIAYDKALERSENLQRELAQWRLCDIIENSPELFSLLMEEYRRRKAEESEPATEWECYDDEDWDCPEDCEPHLELIPVFADSQGGLE